MESWGYLDVPHTITMKNKEEVNIKRAQQETCI